MRVELSNVDDEIHLNCGSTYAGTRVLTVRLGELTDEELVVLVLKLLERKLRELIAVARSPAQEVG